jgi:hypothetical protein
MILHHHRLAPTRDHVIPVARGGGDGPKVHACKQCNETKADMMPDQWNRFMIAYPKWWLMSTVEVNRARRSEIPDLPSQKGGVIFERGRAAKLRRSGPVLVPPELIYGVPAATPAGAEPQPHEPPGGWFAD